MAQAEAQTISGDEVDLVASPTTSLRSMHGLEDEETKGLVAIVSLSPEDSVAYLDSPLALQAARQLSCGKYLAMVTHENSRLYSTPRINLYFICSDSTRSRLGHYVPIHPCRHSTRVPLQPPSDWPFGGCTVETFPRPTNLISTEPLSRWLLSLDDIRYFSECVMHDARERLMAEPDDRRRRTRDEQRAEGVSQKGSIRTTSSLHNSTTSPPPGHAGLPPLNIVRISDDFSQLSDIPAIDNFFREQAAINRIKARFSRPSMNRTIEWVEEIKKSSLLSTAPPPINENVEGNRFRHPALLELAMSLSRPFTPSREDVSKQDNKSHMRDQVGTDADNGTNGDSSGYTWSRAWVGSLPGLYRWDPIEIKPPPGFEWKETEVIYFDIYGTLIDNETGIFVALAPLLRRSGSRLDRREALSAYFEVEVDVQRRIPGLPYSDVLATSHAELALRLGTDTVAGESRAFADSVRQWPPFPDAVLSLHALAPYFRLAAFPNADEQTFQYARSGLEAGVKFTDVFTWNATCRYKPDTTAFQPLLDQCEALVLRKSQTCLVSSSMLHDLEPARELGLPTLWIRRPGSVTGFYGSPAASPVLWVDSLWSMVWYLRMWKGVPFLAQEWQSLKPS